MGESKDTVTVSIHLVNGELQQYADSPALIAKLKHLRARGLEGKALVHELLTDDWGSPPSVVILTDDDTGEEFKIRYD